MTTGELNTLHFSNDGDACNGETQNLNIEEVASQILKAKSNWSHS